MQPPPSSQVASRGQLPVLAPAEQRSLAAAVAAISTEVLAAGGALPFDRYMESALYAPGYGYYVAGAQKFGIKGDFVTAPELSPIFSYCLAAQIAEALAECDRGDILEFGAGSGVMAASLLAELGRTGVLPQRYLILELSADLQRRQAQTIASHAPEFADRVQWLQRLPASGFRGVVLANEVLDAMPVHRFRVTDDGIDELFVVVVDQQGLSSQWRPARAHGLASAVLALQRDFGPLPVGYESEVNLRLHGWMRVVAASLQQGAVLLIDYGYVGREYYHVERSEGTLVTHFRHRAYTDPLSLPGLQDITANVDFSAVAAAGVAADLSVAGFTTQANFLLGTGFDQILTREVQINPARQLEILQQAKLLVLPSEMGERFNVMALTRGLTQPLRGFSIKDLRHRL